MDYRLDLFNAIGAYEDNSTDDDAMFFIAHNKKDGDLMMGLHGDIDIIASVFCDGEDRVNYKENYTKCQNVILNLALNIINNDESMRLKFNKALKITGNDTASE